MPVVVSFVFVFFWTCRFHRWASLPSHTLACQYANSMLVLCLRRNCKNYSDFPVQLLHRKVTPPKLGCLADWPPQLSLPVQPQLSVLRHHDGTQWLLGAARKKLLRVKSRRCNTGRYMQYIYIYLYIYYMIYIYIFISWYYMIYCAKQAIRSYRVFMKIRIKQRSNSYSINL